MSPWRWLFASRRAFSHSRRSWWAGIAETLFAAMLLLSGVVIIAVNMSLVWIFGRTNLYRPVWMFVLRLVLGFAMIVVGLLRIFATLWKVAASEERKGAIVKSAGEIELLNEVRRHRADLPTVPALPKTPVRGTNLRFRLVGSRKKTLALFSTLGLSLIMTVALTLVSITAYTSLQTTVDWLAFTILVFLVPATLWIVQMFIRQMLRISGMGPTTVELSKHPLHPGDTVQMFLEQPGRLRLNLLDVKLICEEEATFDQGTNIRTERRNVYEQRLMRKRGITIQPNSSFFDQFERQLPSGAMHSFKSANNRVQWKIVVHALAKGWPEFAREFAISVHPTSANETEKA